MKVHIIENGAVVNTIVSTIEEAQIAFPLSIVVDGSFGGIGWLFDGANLTNPDGTIVEIGL